MPIQFPCKSCGQTLSVADEHAGKQARCPSCTTVQLVPGGQAPSTSSSSPKSTTAESNSAASLRSDSSAGTLGSSRFDAYSPTTISFGGSPADSPGVTDSSVADSSNAIRSDSVPSPAPLSSGSASPFSSDDVSGQSYGVEKLEPISQHSGDDARAHESLSSPASSSPTASSPGPYSTSSPNAGPLGTPSSLSSAGGSGMQRAAGVDVYYLEAPGGVVYGPVDWRTLVTWKNQGRVAPGFRIRQGTDGPWQIASTTELYATSVNPFADTIPQESTTTQYQYTYDRQDRSGLILAFGILSWVLMFGCGPIGTIFGILAWIFGAQDLRAARQGQLDPRTITSIQVGYYLGMVEVIVSVLCFGGYITMVILAIAAENF